MSTKKDEEKHGAELEGAELEAARKRNAAEEAKFRKARRDEQLEEAVSFARAFGDTMRRELGLEAFTERYLAAAERQAAALETIGRELALANRDAPGEYGRALTNYALGRDGRAPGRTSPAPTRVVDGDLEGDEQIASPAERAVVRRVPAVIAKHMNQNQNRRRSRNR